MFTFGSVPFSEKVYLSNKTLVEPQNLAIGDKLLSLKITEDNINNISDIFSNIIDTKKRIIYKYEICEAVLFSSQFQKNIYCEKVNNKAINKKQYIATKPFQIKGLYGYNDYDVNNNQKKFSVPPFMISNIDEIKRVRPQTMHSYKIKKINKEYSPNLSDIFNEEEITDLGKEVESSLYSLTILGGHFYFTENFIVLADAGEIYE